MMRKRYIVVIFFIVLIFIFGYCYFENTSIGVSKLKIVDYKIPNAFKKYKIVQITDLHNEEFGDDNIKLINYNPEVVVVDLIINFIDWEVIMNIVVRENVNDVAEFNFYMIV